MSENDTDVAKAATRFHEEIPHRFQVSLTSTTAYPAGAGST